MKNKELKNKIEEALTDFNSLIAGLNLNWAEKFKGKIDYEKFVLLTEKKRIKEATNKILSLFPDRDEISKIPVIWDIPTKQPIIGEIIGKFKIDIETMVKRLRGEKYHVSKKTSEDVRRTIKIHNYAIDIAIKIIKGE